MATSKEIEQAKEDFRVAAEELHDLVYQLEALVDLELLDRRADLDEIPSIVDKMRNRLQVVFMSAHFLRQELDK